MTKRSHEPFNNLRFLVDTTDKVIHDLDYEKENCKINNIGTKNIKMVKTQKEAKYCVKNSNYQGCRYCLPEYSG